MGKLKGLFGLAVVAAAFYVAFLVLPHYVANYRLQDEMRVQARLAGTDSKANEDTVREKIAAIAEELGIDLAAEDIHVERRGDQFLVWADYRVDINVPVRPFTIGFHPGTADRPDPQVE